jgi:hypothetical protein
LVTSQQAGRRHAERADHQQPDGDGDRKCGEIFIEQGG